MPENAKNERLLLAEPTVNVSTPSLSEKCECYVTFALSERHDVMFEVRGSVNKSFLFADPSNPIAVSIPGRMERVECTVVQSAWKDDGDTSLVLSPMRTPVFSNDGRPLKRASGALVNLPDYWRSCGASRHLRLSDGKWEVRIVPASDDTVQFLPGIQSEDFKLSHFLEFAKVDGGEFTANEALEQLNLLHEFLSFCRGQWVSMALVAGIAADGTAAFEQWGCGKVSRGQNSNNWLDRRHGESIEQLYPLFAALVRDKGWADAIHLAVYWKVRANTNNVGPDGGCILLQAALERLAWQLLVIQKKAISEDGFTRCQAADQIRLLLSALSVPLSIPSGLRGLIKMAKELNWADGPEAFVAARNRLVHPPKPRAKARTDVPYFEAYSLAMWYVDLAILAACGYRGAYSNCTQIPRWVGGADPVPWA